MSANSTSNPTTVVDNTTKPAYLQDLLVDWTPDVSAATDASAAAENNDQTAVTFIASGFTSRVDYHAWLAKQAI